MVELRAMREAQKMNVPGRSSACNKQHSRRLDVMVIFTRRELVNGGRRRVCDRPGRTYLE